MSARVAVEPSRGPHGHTQLCAAHVLTVVAGTSDQVRAHRQRQPGEAKAPSSNRVGGARPRRPLPLPRPHRQYTPGHGRQGGLQRSRLTAQPQDARCPGPPPITKARAAVLAAGLRASAVYTKPPTRARASPAQYNGQLVRHYAARPPHAGRGPAGAIVVCVRSGLCGAAAV